MEVYAESSAVLRWLLGADDGAIIARELAQATRVVTSAITSAEVARTLRRLVATGDLSPDQRDGAWIHYSSASAHWNVYGVTERVLSRATESFPLEPLRTLDAIHLATASSYRYDVEPCGLLSTDSRLRDNAVALGLAVFPE